MMIRTDKLGVTSVVRSLGFNGGSYDPLIDYFRSDAWKLSDLENCWWKYVSENAPIAYYNGAAVLVGDGIKKDKEGRRMPGVKRQYQESENSSKAETIWGQMYGCVGALAEAEGKTFCIPLACELHDGVKEILSWDEETVQGYRQGSHTVELVSLAHHMTKSFHNAILLLDRYYLTVPALERLDALNAGGGGLRAIIMAKANVIGYEPPAIREKGARGRPPIKGKTVKLAGLFVTDVDKFTQCNTVLYGKETSLRYLVKDLLWGREVYRKIRFVLVEIGARRVIIASTDTRIDPVAIIELYAKRFSIECTFKSMKNDAAAFSNRFWSSCMPLLNRYSKKDEADRTKTIKKEHERKCVRKSLDATEGYVFCGAVATGLLQMISMMHIGKDTKKMLRYQRTPSRTAVSEATVSEYMTKNLFRLLANDRDLTICKIIYEKMEAYNNGFIDTEAS